jgi:hypothetical protein
LFHRRSDLNETYWCTRSRFTSSSQKTLSALAPEIVQDDINAARELLFKGIYQGISIFNEEDRLIGTESFYRLQGRSVPASRNDFLCAKISCNLYRQTAGCAGCASTISPATNLARSFKATHDDIPGMAIAAAIMSSRPSGKLVHCDDGTTTFSAMLP